MKHVLRKYLNKRGSALFMVLSLMTALMVLVMAMYFSVVSSREVQYKVFYQEQSYRSAVSLSDAIISGLRTGQWTDNGTTSMKTAIQSLAVGESISTNGNNFAAFLGTGAEEDNQLGAYTVTISRLEDENSAQMYDMAITVSVNGVVDTTHTFFRVANEQYDAKGPDQTFTSTGYTPNDVYVDGGNFNTDLFFDNEYTVIGGYDQMNLALNGSISAGGSLKIEYHTGTQAIKPLTWAIRNTLYIDATQVIDLGYDENSNGSIDDNERGLVMVGGNYYMNGTVPQNCDIYILGNLYITANQSFPTDGTVRLFVNGDIYLREHAGTCAMPADGVVPLYYCHDVINETSTTRTFDIQPWEEDEAKGILSVSDLAKKLDSATASQTFYKWEINSTDSSKDDYIPELDTRSGGSGNRKTLYFNNGSAYGAKNNTPPGTTVLTLPFDDLVAHDYFGANEDLHYSAHIIEDVIMDKTQYDSDMVNDITLIIDTGDDPRNQHFIKVQANRDFDGDDVNESFCWYPGEKGNTGGYELTILIRGRGSVVIDIPDNVIYQEMEKQWVLHESWFNILGGTYEARSYSARDAAGNWTYTANAELYDTSGIRFVGADDRVTDYIHTSCDETCTSCTYTVTRDVRECTAMFTNGKKCTGKITEVTCNRHEYTYSFCAACGYEPQRKDEDDEDSYYGLCLNRVDRDAVDSKVSSMATTGGHVYDTMFDSSGDIVYPTVNYFLVSCDESADIRFSGMLAADGGSETIMQNALFGFVYAPYMTYSGFGGNSGGGMVKFCGGMIVSDYVLSDSYSMINCMPEYLPTNLISNECAKNKLTSTTGKEWKISLAGY